MWRTPMPHTSVAGCSSCARTGHTGPGAPTPLVVRGSSVARRLLGGAYSLGAFARSAVAGGARTERMAGAGRCSVVAPLTACCYGTCGLSSGAGAGAGAAAAASASTGTSAGLRALSAAGLIRSSKSGVGAPLSTAAAYAAAEARAARLGSWATARHLVKHEGLKSLWSGLSPTLLMSVPATTLYFGAYEAIRDSAAPTFGAMAPLVAGTTARTLAVMTISPLELVRTKMQSAAAERNKGMIGGFRAELRERGPLALWRGVGPTLFRDVPFSAVYWLGYEQFKMLAMRRLGLGEGGAEATSTQTFAVAFAAGASSGTMSAMITHPFDVVKTQVQVYVNAGASAGGRPSSVRVMQRILVQEGVRGLYTGLLPRVVKVAPACAIMISSYEIGKRMFAAYVQDEANGGGGGGGDSPGARWRY